MQGKIFQLTLLFSIIFGISASSWSQTNANDAIRLPDVVGSVRVVERSIRVLSSQQEWQQRARFLFGLHGGYRMEATGRVDFEVQMEPVGNLAFELTIRSGGQELLRQEFRRADPVSAFLAAADEVVRRTMGTPGFFAGKIAFIADRSGFAEVYTSDLLFLQTQQLTSDRSQTLLPNLSPDGRKLLYTSYHRNGFPDIYTIDLSSGKRDIFASFRGTNTGATFSPDGNSVAMILSGSGNSELYVSDAGGGRMRRLTHTDSLEADPTWAPDGQRLAITSDRMGKPQIYTIDVTGRNMQRVPTNVSRNCSEPSWNPLNPNLLAFTAAVGTEFEVVLYDFSKRESRILTKGPGDAVHPAWTNDGRHLIYTERTPTTRRLMVLDTESGKRSVLSPSALGKTEMANFIYNR